MLNIHLVYPSYPHQVYNDSSQKERKATPTCGHKDGATIGESFQNQRAKLEPEMTSLI